MYESKLRLRVFGQDNVSQGSIIRGSRILQLFTDAITEVLVMKGVRIGKLETMDAQFPNVVLSGEYIEVKAIHVRSVSGTWRFQGGFKWSSQHSEIGGCDEHSKTAIGPVWASAITVAGTAASGGTR